MYAKVLLHCHRGCTIDDICAALNIDKAGLFVQKGKTTTQSTRGRSRDWESMSNQYCRALSPQKREELASSLGVHPDSLKALGVGYRAAEQCFTFPERDAQNRVIGITRRCQDGSQKTKAGGRRGLVIPDRLNDLTDPVLIVEGASDVAACLSLELTAIGRPSTHGGIVHLTDLLNGRDVLVFGENDRKRRTVVHVKAASIFPDHESGKESGSRSGFRSGSNDSQERKGPPAGAQNPRFRSAHRT